MDETEKNCRGNHIRATKVHRLRMQAVDHVIRRNPDVRIIYYIRDPRGIWMSREKRHMPVPIYALCQLMYEDHLLFEKLIEKYPDVMLKIKYEDLASSPIATADTIFSHIGETMPDSVRSHLTHITNSDSEIQSPHTVIKSNSTATAWAWRKTMTPSQAEQAIQQCSSAIHLLGYDL